jgi:SAM-dependent methyltransferase
VTEHELHRLRTTFDSVASQYDMARPDYPAQMYGDIRALSGVPDGGDILEIGCGTGQATLPLATRGYHICGIELGENLAAIARRKLAAFPAVEIRVGPFESMPLDEQSFDLAISATAFHWIEAASYPKLARLLRPGGSVALFWNKHIASAVDGGFFERVQSVYRTHAPELYGEGKGLPAIEELRDETANLAATGLFGDFTVRQYPWTKPYGSEAYINLIDTYSDHRMLPRTRRQRLYDGITAMIENFYGGRITVQYLTILYIAHRR